ncbi:conjugative transposon protein TraN [Capnocytophaga stomatis]|uniref:conjugative transposon protein TraN n=1 Tax=Capnocytophaga stomatis TaxID=1848904 RepID=UPI0019525073|nr:conjugative transposon protein TraN [Capnocytophaga stomatis]GIJ95363.1 conjugative transposon protein TraN [Capnocytophaga stomatis]
MNTKTILFTTLFTLFSVFVKAQTSNEKMRISELPIIYMEKGVNIHILSPEPIQFVDLSTNELIGDLPAENIARIKVQENSSDEAVATTPKMFLTGTQMGIITVVGQSFLAQYLAIYQNNCKNCVVSNIQIQPEHMQPLEFPKLKYSNTELRDFASTIIKKEIKKSIRKQTNLKLKMKLNNVYVIGEYIFLDITLENKTNLSCNVEDIKFSIEDKKIYKATNNQSIMIKPLYSFNEKQRKFRKSYRNVFVFEKFTFPNSKILLIRFIEEQISGRTIEMKINYSDILEADTI